MFDDTFEKTLKISIHALLAESDPFRLLESQNAPIFLSTLSLRRATVLVVPSGCWLPISIHALLAESDRAHQQR